jgi:hypothetical protein
MSSIPMQANEFYSTLAIIFQLESATWHSLIGPRVMLSLVHLSATSLFGFAISTSSHLPHVPTTSSYGCHIIHTNDMWHFFIGPHGCLKMPKMSDTWQPLMLAHHPTNINMMSSCQLYDLYRHSTCHPSNGSMWHPLQLLTCLNKKLTGHNFFIRTSFEMIFALLDDYRWSLRSGVIFNRVWGYKVLSILDPLGSLSVFQILLDHGCIRRMSGS